MYENGGGVGYVRKGAGTKAPRHYETTIYCVLNVQMLVRDGYDLFLTQMVLLHDDFPERYFRIVFERFQPSKWTYPIN